MGIGALICSCFTLIFIPITVYQICKSKYASLITVSLAAFNSYFLHYTHRLKHYPTDIFLSIFLIWFGLLFFSKPVTKKKMLFFTILSILCGLFSYTSVILIACLIFYYLFLFETDKIKTKIINFFIFIIPWLLIFIPYLINIGVENVHIQVPWWIQTFCIQNFEDLKLFICSLFGSGRCPGLTVSNYFWYLFIPIIAGILIIFIKKEKYLFSMLILPFIINFILGILYIYPFINERVCLYLSPILLILFILPVGYIKFEKRIIAYIISFIIIIYYLGIYNKASFKEINNYLTVYNYYNFQDYSISPIILDTFRKSDITIDDIVYLPADSEMDNIYYLFTLFDKGKNFINYQVIRETSIFAREGNLVYDDIIPKNKNIYFCLKKADISSETREFYPHSNNVWQYIQSNMDIIYELEFDWHGDKFIKAKRK